MTLSGLSLRDSYANLISSADILVQTIFVDSFCNVRGLLFQTHHYRTSFVIESFKIIVYVDIYKIRDCFV